MSLIKKIIFLLFLPIFLIFSSAYAADIERKAYITNGSSNPWVVNFLFTHGKIVEGQEFKIGPSEERNITYSIPRGERYEGTVILIDENNKTEQYAYKIDSYGGASPYIPSIKGENNRSILVNSHGLCLGGGLSASALGSIRILPSD